MADFSKEDFEELLGKGKARKRAVGNTSKIVGGVTDMHDDDDCRDCPSSRSSPPEKATPKQVMIGCLLLFMLCGSGIGVFLAVYDQMTAGFPYVDVKDIATVKDIFLSGTPWLIYCIDKFTKGKPIPMVYIDGARQSGWKVKTGVAECMDVRLPQSGKTIYERYNFTDKQIPAFIVANGNKPVQLNRAAIYHANALSSFIESSIKTKLKIIFNNKDLGNGCLNRRKCVILGYKKKLKDDDRKTIERKLMTKFRDLRVVAMDTNEKTLSVDKALNAVKLPGQTISLLCLRNPDKSAERTTALARFESHDYFVEADVEAFFDVCSKGSDSQFTPISEAPQMKLRDKKQVTDGKKPQKTEKKDTRQLKEEAGKEDESSQVEDDVEEVVVYDEE